MSRLGVVIFGATGFTGKYAVLEMIRLSKKYPGITWGVAGRSQSKLESLMQDVSKKTGQDQSHIKIIIADVSDPSSLTAMCAQARVIANCCGPYRRLGEPVVHAAVEAGAHHIDVSGEPQFIETIQLKYSEQAKEAGVYVISACGFDSIPNDMGTVFLQQHFGGTLNTVESYMTSEMPPDLRMEVLKHGAIHYGTWESLIQSLAHSDELKPLRMKLYPQRMPEFKPRIAKRSVMHKRDGKWSIPFPGSDNSVVYRTQRTLHAAGGARPAHFRAYMHVGSWLAAVLAIVAASGLFLLTRFSFCCRLLLNHPKLFSFRLVSHEGPSDVVSENTKFSMTLHGEGWDEGTDIKEKPNKRVVAKVSGVNPGYGATVTALLISAITLLEESDKIPSKGGVLTTGAAFRNTSIIQRLSENDLKFEILESTSLTE